MSEVAFVGGCTTGLFVTDQAPAEVRPTFDVDVVAEITSYAEYDTFLQRLQNYWIREQALRHQPR